MKDKASDRDSSDNYDLTRAASCRDDDISTQIVRNQESDDVNENSGAGRVPSPEGDSAAENKIATSLDNE